MRRSLPLIAVLVAMLAWTSSAEALKAGAGGPTRKLESNFTLALSARVGSDSGCYPAPPRLARLLDRFGKFRVGVTGGIGGTPPDGKVYVDRHGSSCNNVRLSLRDGGRLFVLDSIRGDVRQVGRNRMPEIRRQNRGPLRNLTLVGKTFTVTQPNTRVRFEAPCPGRTLPMGGGMINSPGVAPNGENFYPYSFERLGAQRGWHISGWLLDLAGNDARRSVTVQAVCGLGLAPYSAPHKTTFVKPGETQTVVAVCPAGQFLMSGGYQRTDFLRDGGNYATESRALSPNSWIVTGKAYGKYGGELTSIAYCARAPGPLLQEVSAVVPLPQGQQATATTPPCPGGGQMTVGGFSANGANDVFFASGTINTNNTWSATGYGFFGSAQNFTAYGYCLTPGTAAGASTTPAAATSSGPENRSGEPQSVALGIAGEQVSVDLEQVAQIADLLLQVRNANIPLGVARQVYSAATAALG